MNTGDIALVWDSGNQNFDWTQTYFSGAINGNGDVATANSQGMTDLETAVIVSLFTDQVVPPDWKFPQTGILTDPRGWWADVYNDRPIGSLLWLLRFQSGAPNLLQIARNYAEDSLSWLLTEGIAKKVVVTTSWIFPTSHRAIGIAVAITEPVSNVTNRFQYSWAWAVTGSAAIQRITSYL